MFTVDKNVSLPLDTRGPGRAPMYPWLDMEVGDSFFVPESIQLPNAVSRAAYIFGKRHGLKFTRRSVQEVGVKGVRIWRVK